MIERTEQVRRRNRRVPSDDVGLFDWRDAFLAEPLRPALKHLGLTMSLYANTKTGGDVRPGTARLRDDTSLNIHTVHRLRAELVARGWLRVVRKGGSTRDGRRIASVYQLTRPRAQDGGSPPRAPDRGSDTTTRSHAHDHAFSRARPRAADACISFENSLELARATNTCRLGCTGHLRDDHGDPRFNDKGEALLCNHECSVGTSV
jgi:hypothetical protein